MAKRKPAVKTELVPPTPTGKGTEVRGSFGNFLNFTFPGESVEGVIVGKTKVKRQDGKEVERFVILTTAGQTFTLPDHAELTDKLGRLPELSRVFIQFLGWAKANVPGGKVVRYYVENLGTAPGAKAAQGEDVPF